MVRENYAEIQRQQNLVNLGHGRYVERDVLSVVEAIREYDSRLRVKYLDGPAGFNDAPYMITEICNDGVERPVFSVWTLDGRVIERLVRADTQRRNVLAELDRNNNAVRRENNRRYQDSMDEAKDIVDHMIRSPKGRYSFPGVDGVVTVDDDPSIRDYKVELKDESE